MMNEVILKFLYNSKLYGVLMTLIWYYKVYDYSRQVSEEYYNNSIYNTLLYRKNIDG